MRPSPPYLHIYIYFRVVKKKKSQKTTIGTQLAIQAIKATNGNFKEGKP
jgi:hypothetical protein